MTPARTTAGEGEGAPWRRLLRGVPMLVVIGVAVALMYPVALWLGLPLGAGRAEVCRVLSEEPHTRYPVYEESLDHIVGVVHVKELLR